MATPILNITDVAAAQDQKEVTINEAFRTLEAASNAEVSFVITGDLTLTIDELASGYKFVFAGGTGTTQRVILPNVPRNIVVDNQTDADLEVQVSGGTEVITLVQGSDPRPLYSNGSEPESSSGAVSGALLEANRLSEFDTVQKKVDARTNLELEQIDLGTFN